MTPTQFATLVEAAQQIHEESWSDEEKRYLKSHHKAAWEACAKLGVDYDWSKPVEYLNFAAWNDIQIWAKEQTR